MSFLFAPNSLSKCNYEKVKIYCKPGFCNFGDKIFNGIKNSMGLEVVKHGVVL